MIYVISDLHGCYEEYIKMLNLINFNENDTLYVLGDICDRGPSPMKILLHMMEHDNIIPIYGNHDLDAYGALSKIGLYSKKVLLDRDYVVKNDLMDYFEYRNYLMWLADGGKKTLIDYDKLSISNKKKIINYLSDFKYVDEIKVNNINYVLIHSGLNYIESKVEKEEYDTEDLAYMILDYNKTYYKDKVIISGHTPTKLIDKNYEGKILKKNNHIAIDCGCVFGYGLGCLCLNTMEEFYAEYRR